MLTDNITKFKSHFPLSSSAELRLQTNRTKGVTFVAGNLTANSRSETSGVSSRVYRNGVYGFASAASADDEAILKVLKTAGENAVFMDNKVNRNKGMFAPVPAGSFSDGVEISDIPQKEFIEFGKQIDSYITNKYKNLTSRIISLREECIEKVITTSDGYNARFILPRSYVYVFLSTATNAGVTVELFAPTGGYGTFDKNFDDPAKLYPVIDEYYDRLMQKRDGVYADAGLKTVILGGDLSGMLAHEAVGHTVEGDLVLNGSVAKHNLGKQVASELVSLVDFAHTYNGDMAPIPVYVDDEGTLAKDAVLIDKGILTGYMTNRELASHFGMVPTGNVRAFLFSDEPIIRMRNTAILPGKDKLEDMIASVDDGYYLLSTMNGQADTTGEFMFGITMGYEIKNGKLGKAILDTTISGVAFEMLKTVDMVSDGMTWSSFGYCGKKQPMPVGMGGPAVRCKVMIGGR